MKKSVPLTAAYVAGLLDGEGCISIHQGNASKGRRGVTYRALVTVGMTEPALPLLRRLKEQYGGGLNLSRKATGTWAAAHAWTVSGAQAANLLMAVREHLQMKVAQADLCLALHRMMERAEKYRNGSTRWTAGMREQAALLKAQINALNQKGPTPNMPPLPGEFARLVGGLWVTPQLNMFRAGGLQPFCGDFPPSGTMRSGRVSAQSTWARPTVESGCGSSLGALPPPTAAANALCPSMQKREAHRNLLPTPQASDGSGGGQAKRMSGRRRNLNDAVVLWPTPDAMVANLTEDLETWLERRARTKERVGNGNGFGTPLAVAVRLPGDGAPTESSGSLNPRWVEWLMGFPDGWTDCAPSETP